MIRHKNFLHSPKLAKVNWA